MNLENLREYVGECLKEADLEVRARLSDPLKQAEFEREMDLVGSRTATYTWFIERAGGLRFYRA